MAGIHCGDRDTLAVLANSEGRILGRGLSKLRFNNPAEPEEWLPAVEQALEEACISAGCSSAVPDLAWIGISGLGRRDGHELETYFQRGQLGRVSVHVSSEADLVLAAGVSQGWGVAISAGATSMVVATNPEGIATKAGGWGSLFGENGSAFAVGMLAVQALTRSLDGRAGLTLLVDGIMQHWNIKTAGELYHKVYLENITQADFVDLVDIVLNAARDGDVAARAILHKTADDLACLTSAVATRLELPSKFPCALYGSILTGNSPIRKILLEELIKKGFMPDPILEVKEPVLGAVRLAISNL